MKLASAAASTISSHSSRREFLQHSGRFAAASALAGLTVPAVHAGEEHTIQLAIIGSGNRGSGAVGNALSAPGGPVKLIAMADLFQDRLDRSHAALAKQFGDKIDVPPERRFIGFHAYRRAIDCLRPGDVALLTTHAAFRAVHLEYAVEKGVNVFMEKRSSTRSPTAPRPRSTAGSSATVTTSSPRSCTAPSVRASSREPFMRPRSTCTRTSELPQTTLSGSRPRRRPIRGKPSGTFC